MTSVEGYRPLGGTETGSDPEHGRIGPRCVHPAHLSTLLSEQSRAIGGRWETAQVKDPDAAQRTFGAGQEPTPTVITSSCSSISAATGTLLHPNDAVLRTVFSIKPSDMERLPEY
jgi:hypothetical protein